MCRSTEEREEDLTGGFVPHAQADSDDLEEGEVPLGGFIAHGGSTQKKSTHANFLRRLRKRKQVAAVYALDAKGKATAKLLAAEKKNANIVKNTRWHVSIANDSMRLVSEVLALFHIPHAVVPPLIRDFKLEVDAIPLSQFKAMGGQAGVWPQARRQYQFPTNKSNIPSSRLVVMIKSFMALCGWHIVRAMFCIVGCSHQFMHRDRGHYHSVSLFVCLVARHVRFGRRDGEDFEVFMNAGDVLAFNGLVWHSGLANDSDSCAVFMYFDCEPFYITDEMRADKTADQSRFGFTKMYSEEQWVQYSATYTADQDTYTTVQLENMEMLPTSLLRPLVLASEFTLDM